MRLQCLVCKRQFEPSERFVKLTAYCKHEGSTSQGVSMAICRKHLSEEIADALLLTTAGWSDHTNQVFAEKHTFED